MDIPIQVRAGQGHDEGKVGMRAVEPGDGVVAPPGVERYQHVALLARPLHFDDNLVA